MLRTTWRTLERYLSSRGLGLRGTLRQTDCQLDGQTRQSVLVNDVIMMTDLATPWNAAPCRTLKPLWFFSFISTSSHAISRFIISLLSRASESCKAVSPSASYTQPDHLSVSQGPFPENQTFPSISE